MNPDVQQPAMSQLLHSSNVVAGLVRFFHAVRVRRGTLLAALALSAALGIAYYLTATRLYDAYAQVNIVQSEANHTQLVGGAHGANDVFQNMATYQRNMISDRVLRSALKDLQKEHRVDFAGIPVESWPTVLKNNVSVTNERGTTLIDVRCRSSDPRAAAVLTERIVTEFINYINTTTGSYTQQALEQLTQEKNGVSALLAEKNEEFTKLQKESGAILDPDGRTTSITALRVIDLNRTLTEAERATLDAWGFLQAADQAARTGQNIQQVLLQAVESLGASILAKQIGLGEQDAWTLAKLNEELLRLQSDFASRRQILGDNNPELYELRQQIKAQQEYINGFFKQTQDLLQSNSADMGPKLLTIAQQRYQAALARQNVLRQQFDAEKTEAINHNDLIAKLTIVQLDRKRLLEWEDVLIERIRDLQLVNGDGIKVSLTRFPRPSLVPSSPRLVLVVAVCFVLGLGGGLGLIYLLDLLDDRFRSPDELRMQLGVPVLAMVRAMQPTGGTGVDAVQCYAKPNGVETEAFRTLRTAISFSDRQAQRIVVTSTEPGDGKTTVMSNLAVAFAQSGKRTLLIDADMRRPGLTALLSLKGQQGLSQVLRDDRPMADSVADNLFARIMPGLDVIPSGSRPSNPSELLGSERFSELLAWAEGCYDQILIDAPPVLAVTDPIVISRMVDGAVLVIRPDKNRRHMVIRAAEAFTAVEVNLLGVVVNHLTSESSGDYYGYGYNYGYGYGYGHDDAPTANEAETEQAAHEEPIADQEPVAGQIPITDTEPNDDQEHILRRAA